MGGITLLLAVGVAGWLVFSGRLRRMNGLDGIMIALAAIGAVLAAKGRMVPGGTLLAVALLYGWRTLRSTRAPERAEPAQYDATTFAHAAKLVEARAILGLDEKADEALIRAAHRRLIAKAHPDVGGTQGLAEKINDARDILLRHHNENKRSYSPQTDVPPYKS